MRGQRLPNPLFSLGLSKEEVREIVSRVVKARTPEKEFAERVSKHLRVRNRIPGTCGTYFHRGRRRHVAVLAMTGFKNIISNNVCIQIIID